MDKMNCCGCSACVSICPKQCITMQVDEEGFLYPWTDKEKCSNCGLCDKVCMIKICICELFKKMLYYVHYVMNAYVSHRQTSVIFHWLTFGELNRFCRIFLTIRERCWLLWTRKRVMSFLKRYRIRWNGNRSNIKQR